MYAGFTWWVAGIPWDIAHGAGLAIVFPAWASYVMSTDWSRFADLGRNVFGIECSDNEEAAKLTVEAFKDFFKSLNMPLSLADIGISIDDKQLNELLDKATFYGKRTLGNFRILEREGRWHYLIRTLQYCGRFFQNRTLSSESSSHELL